MKLQLSLSGDGAVENSDGTLDIRFGTELKPQSKKEFCAS